MTTPTDLEREVARALFSRYLGANRWSLNPPDWAAWPEFHDVCIEDARAAIEACFRWLPIETASVEINQHAAYLRRRALGGHVCQATTTSDGQMILLLWSNEFYSWRWLPLPPPTEPEDGK